MTSLSWMRIFGDLMRSLGIWWAAIRSGNPRTPLKKLFTSVILVHNYLYKAQAVLVRSEGCLNCLLQFLLRLNLYRHSCEMSLQCRINISCN